MFFLNTFIDLVQLISDYVDKEVNDANKLQQQLFETRLKYEMDEITEEEYKETEVYLIKRISEIREKEMNEEEDDEEGEE